MTLAETLVAITIFLGILVTVIGIERTGRDALTKTDVNSDAFRMASLVADQVKRELQDASVWVPTAGGDPSTIDVSQRTGLQMYQPDLLEPSLTLRFLPGSNPSVPLLRKLPSTLTTAPKADGTVALTRTGGGRPDLTMGSLGPGGHLSFAFDPDALDQKKLVHVSILAFTPNQQAVRQSQYHLELDVALSDTTLDEAPDPSLSDEDFSFPHGEEAATDDEAPATPEPDP